MSAMNVRRKSTERERARWRAASAARRQRLGQNADTCVFRLPISADLVAAALLVARRDAGLDTSDREICEKLLTEWINEFLLRVIDDLPSPADLTDVVAELKSRDHPFRGPE
jgi:hypothetical protein